MVTPGTKQAKGFAVQISLLLENIPNLDLGESSEFPASKILTDKTVHRFVSLNDKAGAEEATGAPKPKAASKKRPATDVEVAVAKKKRIIKTKSVTSLSTLKIVAVAQDIVPLQMVEPCPNVPAIEHVKLPAAEEGISAAQSVEVSIGKVDNEIDASADRDKPADTNEERHWFDLTHEELIAKWAAERIITSPADTDEEIGDDKPFFKSVEAVESVVEVEEAAVDKDFLVVDDPDTVINQVLQHLDSSSADKDVKPDEEAETMDVDTAGGDQQVRFSGEEPVVQKTNDDLLDDDEQTSLEDILLTIPVDVPLPSAGMEVTKIVMGKEIKIPEVTERTWFLNSLPKIPPDNKGKASLVEKDPIKGNPAQDHYLLICADIDLLVALRAKVVDEVAQFFNSFSLKKLATIHIEEMYKKEELVLSWGETESPQLAIQRKFYILLKYREVLVWKFLESWRSNFVPGQGSSAVDLSVIDLLSDIHLSVLEELMKEARTHGITWKKTCCSKMFEGSPRDRGAVIARSNTNTQSSCWIRTMLRVDGSWIIEPCADQWVKIPRKISSCEVQRQRQYDDTLPSVSDFFRVMKKRWADVCLESFLSSIALNRTVFRSAQISHNTVSAAPSVQLSLDQRQSSSTSADSSSSLNFDATDLDAPVSSLPTVSIDFSAALADLQAILLAQIDESQSGISSRLHKIEQSLCDSLRDQADIFKNLSQGAGQEARTIDDVQTLRFNDFRKNVLAQNASIFTGLADVRKEVQEVNAKVDILASRLNDVQKNVEETKEALCHQLLEFQSQSQENQNILHTQLSELVNYINRVSADKKEESSSRGPQPPDAQISASAERTPSLAQRIEMAQRHIVHTVLDADSNRESLERQAAAERDRERRRMEARSRTFINRQVALQQVVYPLKFSSWDIRWKSADGMQSVVDLFSEIFSRYIPCKQSAADAFFKVYQQTVGSSTVYIFQKMDTVNINQQVLFDSKTMSLE
ncbi:carbon catabolite-derepressing protein kinase-like [Dorcoceras hygrometricum]|uniref:Carbon catabolite-derepressing protein kinase-like n=1 Tax=Dorcoceras hygrometricum TaxID=472368 RepID=A0A2Z7BNN0_9LAMI|nr:carbon catabolite-derepressing protein kinase-like [Dorcoceras hygrometricum]